jgi:FAD synthetase
MVSLEGTKIKKVVVVGTFDILHLGHLWLLNKAKEFGDWLTVVVARDESALQLKGRKPVFPEEERLELLKNLKVVDEAVLGYRGDRLKIIKELKPDVLILGPDPWDKKEVERQLKKKGLEVNLVKIRHIYSKSKFYRTGQIIDYIKNEYPAS